MCDRQRAPIRHRPWWPLFVLPAFALATLGPALAAQGSERGNVRRGTYTAPMERFTVPVPRGSRVTDAHAAERGAFSVWDTYGHNTGFLYTIGGDTAADPAQLRAWVDSVVMPTFLRPASDRAAILADSVASFDGRPALFLLLDLPEGGVLEETSLRDGVATKHRSDSRRVAVAFQRGEWRILAFTETDTFFGKAASPADDWMRHATALQTFWATVAFKQ